MQAVRVKWRVFEWAGLYFILSDLILFYPMPVAPNLAVGLCPMFSPLYQVADEETTIIQENEWMCNF